MINKKEGTLKLKMVRKSKEYIKKGTLDINTIIRDIYKNKSFKHQEKIFDNIKKDYQINIQTFRRL